MLTKKVLKYKKTQQLQKDYESKRPETRIKKQKHDGSKSPWKEGSEF